MKDAKFEYGKEGQGSLRSRKKALKNKYTDEPMQEATIKEEIVVKKKPDLSGVEELLKNQLDIINQQNKKIEALVDLVKKSKVSTKDLADIENTEVYEVDESDIIDKFIQTEGYDTEGDSKLNRKVSDENIDDKVAMLRKLKGGN